MGFPCGSAGKESACNAGDLGLIPGLGRFPGEGNSYPPSVLAWRISKSEQIHLLPITVSLTDFCNETSTA